MDPMAKVGLSLKTRLKRQTLRNPGSLVELAYSLARRGLFIDAETAG
jgi:hypothetical protein